MITSYVVTDRTVPVSPETLLASLRARGVWQEAAVSSEPGLLWDTLHLVQPPFEASVQFTVGDALPAEVRDWLPWAGRSLGDGERGRVEQPAATYRIEAPVLAGGVPLPSPQARIAEADRQGRDHPRRQAHFVAAVAAEIALAVDGVLVDVMSQRFWASEVARFTAPAFDVRDYVSVHAEVGDEGLHLHTHGLARFGRPDVEVGHVPREALTFGTHVLNEVAQHQALGNIVQNGETVLIDGEYPFAVSMTARSKTHVGNEVFALVDPPDAPERDARVPRFTLARFCEDVADDLMNEADLEGACTWLTHSVTLAPHRAAAWRKRAAAQSHMGRRREAAEDLARAVKLESSDPASG